MMNTARVSLSACFTGRTQASRGASLAREVRPPALPADTLLADVRAGRATVPPANSWAFLGELEARLLRQQSAREGPRRWRLPRPFLPLCVLAFPPFNGLDWIIDIAPHGAIEFVPKSDPTIQTMLALRKDNFEEYTEDNFRNYIKTRAEIFDINLISHTGRKLYIYKRKNN